GSAAHAATGLAEVNGARLWYEEAGRGPAVVLLHGGLVDARLWDDQMLPLSRRYRAVRYDLRGYGKSSAPTESFSHVEDLRALLDFLKIDRATLVGLSLGGIVAADFALEHPERVERLVLVGPGLRGDMQPPDKAMEEVWKAIQDRDDGKVVAAYMGSPLYAAVRAGTTARARLERMLTDNLDGLETLRPGFIKYPEPATAERLGDVRAPTLVVIGDRDGRNLLNIADTLAAKIPGARKAVIRGASHHPPVETPKEFNRILLGFLREPLPAGK
ncbi:MAG TPA: alpha/beta fold hydrolase, partial [Pyrinomonadaceae bacterium]|nr:alpha/beta fold hydrolase [Pyrinomonadaceae bacterium]